MIVIKECYSYECCKNNKCYSELVVYKSGEKKEIIKVYIYIYINNSIQLQAAK